MSNRRRRNSNRGRGRARGRLFRTRFRRTNAANSDNTSNTQNSLNSSSSLESGMADRGAYRGRRGRGGGGPGPRGATGGRAGGSGGPGGGGGPPAGPSFSSSQMDSICPICRSMIVNLCITNCNHRFCRECITRWTDRNATCPSCRQNIHTIRNILPDGGTEIIQISRAELVAHKVNEIHSILILLFTVMAHSLLPEVNSYLDQLNELARELNVPTTSSRLERAVLRAIEARDTTSRDSSPSTPAAQGQRQADSGGQARNADRAAAIRLRFNTTPTRDTAEDSDDEASNSGSSTTATRGSADGNIVGSFPALALLTMGTVNNIRSQLHGSTTAGSPATSPAQSASAPTSSSSNAQTTTTTSTTTPSLPNATQSAQATSRTPPSSAPTTPSSHIPGPTSAATAITRSLPTSSAPQTPTSTTATTRSLPTSSTPQTSTTTTASRWAQASGPGTTITGGRLAPSTLGSSSQPPSAQSSSSSFQPLTRYVPPHSRDATTNTRAASWPPAGNRRTMHFYNSNAPGNQFTATRAGSLFRPPTAEEARRNQEQRARDIRLLTESFHKINQVREVLTIMHMVIHRNQVQLDSSRTTSPADNADD